MKFFNLIAILIVISSIFAYINFRFIKLPSVIGVMLVSILVSLGMILADRLGLGIAREGEYLLKNIDFKNTLMVWMLGFLLFNSRVWLVVGGLYCHDLSLNSSETVHHMSTLKSCRENLLSFGEERILYEAHQRLGYFRVPRGFGGPSGCQVRMARERRRSVSSFLRAVSLPGR
jgi:hypothetical protein